ncbi:hypothetical protein MXAZACID_08249 [Acidocella sp. MX-AZ02]|nr:hypothetical protein MXAZACID_08249 [Acidocella sp. MX-AZ02]
MIFRLGKTAREDSAYPLEFMLLPESLENLISGRWYKPGVSRAWPNDFGIASLFETVGDPTDRTAQGKETESSSER